MKNFPKTIALLSLSLLTIGAMATGPKKGLLVNLPAKKTVPLKAHLAKHIMGGAHASNKKNPLILGNTQANINYVDGDYAYGNYSNSDFTAWNPLDIINHYYTIADTGADVSGYPPNATINTLNSVTVAFDTIYDAWSNNLYSANPGTAEIDTIWANVALHKTSAGVDTCIFWIYQVSSSFGFPTNQVIGSDTLLLDSTSLPSVISMDSVYTIALTATTPNCHLPLAIPASARKGWNFCITADYRNPNKMDTFGIEYFSQYLTCSPYDYCADYTTMGVPGGYNQFVTYAGTPAVNTVNSWQAGYYYYNTARYSGTNSQLYWPDTSSTNGFTGLEDNGTYYFYGVPCAGDTQLSIQQDIAISASIDFNIFTGVNAITASGLSVGQNYPNPFNKETQIAYSLTKSSDVTFSVYDMTGRVLVNNVYANSTPGQHTITLGANSLSPGVYFYTFNVDGAKVTKRMVITE